MAGRNRLPAHALKGGLQAMPSMHEGPYAMGAGPLPPHPALVDEMRNGPHGRGPGPMLPHPGFLEERLSAQHQEIQGLLLENQRLAATHVALRQELASTHQELQHLSHVATNMQADKDHQLRGLYDNSKKLEAEMRAMEPMKAELMQLQADNQKMGAVRQELTSQIQSLTQELTRAWNDMQQSVPLRTEIESLHGEFERARTAIEYEKKARAGRQEQGQAMEKNFISMSREVEKLRAELAKVDKRERGAANPGGAYAGNYGSAEKGYSSGAYGGDGYGMHPVQGAEESAGQYGAGAAPWGAYEMQRSHNSKEVGDGFNKHAEKHPGHSDYTNLATQIYRFNHSSPDFGQIQTEKVAGKQPKGIIRSNYGWEAGFCGLEAGFNASGNPVSYVFCCCAFPCSACFLY